MRIQRSTILQGATPIIAPRTPPAPPAQARTRYGIKHTDGRWLALSYQHGRIMPVWGPVEHAWSWPYMTSAIAAALDVDQADLLACGPWTAEAVPGTE